jgi:hypothetical protein
MIALPALTATRSSGPSGRSLSGKPPLDDLKTAILPIAICVKPPLVPATEPESCLVPEGVEQTKVACACSLVR